MSQRLIVLTFKHGAAALALLRLTDDGLISDYQLSSMPLMTGLAAWPPPTSGLPSRRLPRWIARWRLRRIRRIKLETGLKLSNALLKLLNAFLLPSDDLLLRLDDRQRVR
jgi:hypothetical protein